MKRNQNALASVHFRLNWESEQARHTEWYYGPRINFWRDCFPPAMQEQLLAGDPGDRFSFRFAPGQAVPAVDPASTFDIRDSQFNRRFQKGPPIAPRSGRFYPKGILKGISHVFPENIQPFRCAEVDNGRITVDFNHPLAGRPLELNVELSELRPKFAEQGGTCVDWLETVTEGPGIQARWRGQPTDFFSENPFARKDEQPDEAFYEQPRLVDHLDAQARQTLTSLYKELLAPGERVLDLMSSWKSHLPEAMDLKSVVGLGMNAAELSRNPRLSEYQVRDLNRNPVLPFADGVFDAVICTASVEYLNQPLAVFEEVRRVLGPGGLFVASFSNRWFEPKTIRIWTELHEFERMGLVSEYFLKTGFADLATFSSRGFPRPETDKYYGQLPYSDPVYAVWGYKA